MRCSLMDVTPRSIVTTLTPKLLEEKIVDQGWAVDQILTTAPAYEKKGKDKKSQAPSNFIQLDTGKKQLGRWITEPS